MKRAPSLLLALACTVAAWLSISLAPASPPAGSQSVRGLSEVSGGGAVPESARPPGALPGDGGPSTAVFPPQRLTIRFNHAAHAQGLKISCTTCHDRAKTSRSSADRLLPPGSRCDACHGSDHSNGAAVKSDPNELIADCGFCHLGYRPGDGNRVERLLLPTPNLKFNHALHVARGATCQSCHGTVERLELATRDALPRMRACVSCHRSSTSSSSPAAPSGACSTCHLSEGLRLKTQFGNLQLLPPQWMKDSQHGPDWLARHKSVAGDDSRFCGNCHSEKSCADCHDGRVRPRLVHPNDFLSMHAVSARQNSPRCTSCHQQQSFCLSCHQRAGVAQSGPFGNFAERGRFHPPPAVWTEGARAPRHHAWEAARNLNACISCHTERDCVACHSTRSVGGPGNGLTAGSGRGANPHSVGFRSRCGRALRQNARPCLVCHDPADPNLAECR
jgi:hypothetical protein